MVGKKKSFLKIGLALVLSVFVFLGVGYSQTALKPEVAILQGSIHLQAIKSLPDDPVKIQPGTPVKILVSIENQGDAFSPAGEIYVRYAFTKPLDGQPNSVIFQTEKVAVKELAPGKKVDVQFTSTQPLPSIFDFIRYDWPMREYQAIYVVDQAEKMIGKLAITFSAYYYPGLKHEIPIEYPNK